MTSKRCFLLPRSPIHFRRDAQGVAAVEMALVLPILLALLMGTISYGDWFLTAHTVQQAANDAARSAIAGLTSSERQQLATSTFTTMMQRSGALNAAKASVIAVDDDGQTLAVRVLYDASADPLLHVSFVAPPNPMIQRSAAISLGGV